MFHPQGPSFWELTRQALCSTVKGYDLLAPKFDYTPFRTPDSVIDLCLQAALSSGPVEEALDLCCGTGPALVRLGLGQHARNLVGIDFSPGMLKEAKAHLDAAGIEAQLDCDDVLQMPYVDRFDLAVSFGAFGHIQRHQEQVFVSGIFRALKPGGRFVFVSAEHPPVFSLAWLLSRCFNGVMRLRNLLPGEPFIMYYLTFMLPDVLELLRAVGFEVQLASQNFPAPFSSLKVVIASKPTSGSQAPSVI